MPNIYTLNFLLLLFLYVEKTKKSYSCVIFLIFVVDFSSCTSYYLCNNVLCNFCFLLCCYLTKMCALVKVSMNLINISVVQRGKNLYRCVFKIFGHTDWRDLRKNRYNCYNTFLTFDII